MGQSKNAGLVQLMGSGTNAKEPAQDMSSGTVTVGTITGTFTPGETITQATSLVTATLVSAVPGLLTFSGASGPFLTADVITGGTSGAHAAATAGSTYTNIVSPALVILTVDDVSLQFLWTGTPTGVISIAASNDYEDTNGHVSNAGTWDTLTLSPAITQPAGGASHYTVWLALIPAKALQVTYVPTSGAGTLSINCCFKGL